MSCKGFQKRRYILCLDFFQIKQTLAYLQQVVSQHFTGAMSVQAKKLEAEVLAPMQRWTTAYNTVQARMNKLEGVRLEVDSRRRTVAELGQKIDKQRARLPQTKSKGEFDIEQTIKKVQHKENKLAGESNLSPAFVFQSWLVGCATCHIRKQCETCCRIALQNANNSLYML